MKPVSTPENRERSVPVPPVDLSEPRLEYARSSGAGGQNVNRRDTKAVLHWHVGSAKGFTAAQKTVIRARLSNRLNSADEIVLHDQTERSQDQNKAAVLERLQRLVAEALTPQKERHATRVPRSQKRQRLDGKRKTAFKKKLRRVGPGEW